MTPTSATHSLQPFSDPAAAASPLALHVRIERHESGTLFIDYTLTGPLDAILLPPRAACPARRDGLWQTTCFEAFIAPAGRPEYLELNLAPSGDWNAYRFTGYREGMTEIPRANAAVFGRRRGMPAEFVLAACFDLPLDLVSVPLEVGLTAVIEDLAGNKSCWALAHTGSHPDFHRRDSFLVRL